MALEEELATYRRELPKMLAAQEGQYALVHGQSVGSFWPTKSEAYKAGCERFGLKPFLIKKVEAVEPVYDIYIDLNRPAPLMKRTFLPYRLKPSSNRRGAPMPTT